MRLLDLPGTVARQVIVDPLADIFVHLNKAVIQAEDPSAWTDDPRGLGSESDQVWHAC